MVALLRRHKSLEDFSGGDAWREMGELLRPVVLPKFAAAFLAGASAAAAQPRVRAHLRAIDAHRSGTKALVVDFELIAQRAEAAIRSYYDAWWSKLSGRLQGELRTAIQDALATGGGGREVARQIGEAFRAEQFSAARIATIAVTETTRLMGRGAQQTYQAAGFTGWRRQTAQDADVCPECDADTELHPMSDDFEPLHPNDRCWPVPEGASTEPIADQYLVEDTSIRNPAVYSVEDIPGLAEGIVRALEESGGDTVAVYSGERPEVGFGLSTSKGTELVVTHDNFNEDVIDKYRADHARALARPNAHLGVWGDGDSVYIDISRVMLDREQAITAGIRADQEAIYDFGSGQSIYLRGPNADPDAVRIRRRLHL